MFYFTADTHFGHDNACNFPFRKGFTSETWSDLIIDIINKTVTKSDRLYILGDFALGGRLSFINYRQLIRVKDLWLIKGNHCPSDKLCVSVFGQRFRHTHECKIKGKSTWLSHYPHMIWPKSHYGSYHLHGHLHDQRSLYWDEIWPEQRRLDVCPESYHRLKGDWGIWSEEEIFEYMENRKGHDDLSYYRNKYGKLGD